MKRKILRRVFLFVSAISAVIVLLLAGLAVYVAVRPLLLDFLKP